MTATVTVDYSGETLPSRPNAGGQTDFACDFTHRYVGLEGGWGSGKTWIGARKLVALHMLNAFDADGAATYVPSALIGPSYQGAFTYCVPNVLQACEDAGVTAIVKTAGQDAPKIVIKELGTRKRASQIYVRTQDHPEAIAGWEAGVIWGDETARWRVSADEPVKNPILQMNGRLRHPAARLLQGMHTYTNEGNVTAILKFFRDPTKKDRALYRAATRENPIMRTWEQEQRSHLTPELAEQYLDGGVIDATGGRIYRQFTQDNVDASIELNPALPLHTSWDFNINPGMHVLIGQYLREEDLFITTHEIHGPRMTVIDAAKRFARLIDELGGWQWPDLHIFGDATGGSEWMGTGQSNYDIIRTQMDLIKIKGGKSVPYRIRVPGKNPLVSDRHNACNIALRDMEGRIHWKVHPRCERMCTDLEELAYDKKGEVDKSDRKRSHASDAEGYRVHYLRPLRVITIPTGRMKGVPV